MDTYTEFMKILRQLKIAEKRLDRARFYSEEWKQAQQLVSDLQGRVDFLIQAWPEAELEAPYSTVELGAYNSEAAWMQTHSGKVIYPLKPDIDVLDIHDIAHALARINRFNGHAKSPVPVAYHSLVVAENVSPKKKLQALIHDGPEYILGDIIRPLKMTPFFRPFKALEDEWLRLMGIRFGFDTPLDEEIKFADNGALALEKQMDCSPCEKPWQEYPHTEITKIPDPALKFNPIQLTKVFLAEFHAYGGKE